MGKVTVIKVTLKLHCETRWLSKKQAVSALFYNLEKIYNILLEISTNDNLNKETTAGAKIILKQINFNFFCLLHIWNNISMVIDRVNCSLQDKRVSIDIATNIIKGLF
jgi:hypothetical protein